MKRERLLPIAAALIAAAASLAAQSTSSDAEPPVVPVGLDAYRQWDRWAYQRIGAEILKHQAEAYRRLRNTLRYLLGSLDGFSAAEKVEFTQLPELDRWVLHRLAELDDPDDQGAFGEDGHDADQAEIDGDAATDDAQPQEAPRQAVAGRHDRCRGRDRLCHGAHARALVRRSPRMPDGRKSRTRTSIVKATTSFS